MNLPRFSVINIEDENEVEIVEVVELPSSNRNRIRRISTLHPEKRRKRPYRFANESARLKEDLVCDMFVEKFAEKSRVRWTIIRILNKFFPNYCAISPLQRIASQMYFNSGW